MAAEVPGIKTDAGGNSKDTNRDAIAGTDRRHRRGCFRERGSSALIANNSVI